MPKDPKLLLYVMQRCPYCQKVQSFLDQIQKKVPRVDILEDPMAKEELIRIGGKKQVPCLLIDGAPLYESLDIIEWFKAHFARD